MTASVWIPAWGGADPERDRVIALLLECGMETHVVLQGPPPSGGPPLRVLASDGRHVHRYEPGLLRDKVTLLVGSSAVGEQIPELVSHGRPRRLIWCPSGSEPGAQELEAIRAGLVDRVGYTSELHRRVHGVKLGELGFQETFVFPPYVSHVVERSRLREGTYTVGVLLGEGVEAAPPDLWRLLDGVLVPKGFVRQLAVLGFTPVMAARRGAPPRGLAVRTWKPGELQLSFFLDHVDVLLHKSGGPRELSRRKGLQAFAQGVVLLAEPGHALDELIEPGETGFLSASSEELIYRASHLAANPEHYRRLSESCMRTARERAGREACWEVWKEELQARAPAPAVSGGQEALGAEPARGGAASSSKPPGDMVAMSCSNRATEHLLVDWMVSLRSLGGYSGEIVVLDYGLTERAAAVVDRLGGERVRCVDRGAVWCTRLLDAARLLRGSLASKVVAMFDADIWFQGEVAPLFELGRQCRGVVHGPDAGWYREPFRGTQERLKRPYLEKTEKLSRKYGGTVQVGMLCGRAPALLAKLEAFSSLVANGGVDMGYGPDQFAVNHLFDEASDSLEAHLYNAVGADTVCVDGTWYSHKRHAVSGSLEKVRALHCVGMVRQERLRQFRLVHRQAAAACLAAHGVAPFAPNLRLERWGDSESASVEQRLLTVLRVCQAHEGHSLGVGSTPDPAWFFDDIGATALVHAHHGREGLWNGVGLSHRPHLACPETLWLSRRAVDALAGVTPTEVSWLCRRAQGASFGLILSLLCAKAGLSFGPAVWEGALAGV